MRAGGAGRTPASGCPGCSSNTAQHICRVQRLSLPVRQANFVKKAFLATVTRGRSSSASTYNAGVGSGWLTVGKVVSSPRQLTSLPEAPGDRAVPGPAHSRPPAKHPRNVRKVRGNLTQSKGTDGSIQVQAAQTAAGSQPRGWRGGDTERADDCDLPSSSILYARVTVGISVAEAGKTLGSLESCVLCGQ